MAVTLDGRFALNRGAGGGCDASPESAGRPTGQLENDVRANSENFLSDTP
jgi:hypothetical protein